MRLLNNLPLDLKLTVAIVLFLSENYNIPFFNPLSRRSIIDSEIEGAAVNCEGVVLWFIPQTLASKFNSDMFLTDKKV